MRNLKKFLALVLALMMVVSVMVTVSATEYTDKGDIDAAYKTAVEIMTKVGVFKGTSDTEFSPTKEITRAEMAAIIYRIMTGDVDDEYVEQYRGYENGFTDVTAGSWYEPYVNYCANARLLVGDGKGNFMPGKEIDGYQVLAVLLRCVGYDQPGEFEGSNWRIHTAQIATQRGITQGLDADVTLADKLERQAVAQLTYNAAVLANRVHYTPAFSYREETKSLITVPKTTDVTFDLDEWGAPKDGEVTATFNYPITAVKQPITVPAPEAIVDTYEADDHCDVAAALKVTENKNLTVYTNGKENKSELKLQVLNEKAQIGAQGRWTRIFKIGSEYSVVYVDTLLAKVVDVKDHTTDDNGHLKTPATLTLWVYDGNEKTDDGYTVAVLNGKDTDWTSYTKDQYLLVNYRQASATDDSAKATASTDTYSTWYVLGNAPETKTGAQTVKSNNKDGHTIEGTKIPDNNRYVLDVAGSTMNKGFTWFLDTKGNIIGSAEVTAVNNFGVITSIYWKDNGDGTGSAIANVTFVDGTTDTLNVGTMTVAGSAVGIHGDVNATESGTAVNADTGDAAMSFKKVNNKDYFFVSTTADANEASDLVDGHLFKITAGKNGTYDFVEVAGDGAPASDTYAAFKGLANDETDIQKGVATNGTVKVNDATVFLVRSGEGTEKDPYTYESIKGFNNIPGYTTNEVDYVDVDGDGDADYVYVIADPTGATGWHLFFIDAVSIDDKGNAKAEIDENDKTYTVYGYLDGSTERTSVTIKNGQQGWVSSNGTTDPENWTGEPLAGYFANENNGNTMWMIYINNGYVVDVNGARANEAGNIEHLMGATDNSGAYTTTGQAFAPASNSPWGMQTRTPATTYGYYGRSDADLGIYKNLSVVIGTYTSTSTTKADDGLLKVNNSKTLYIGDVDPVVGDYDDLESIAADVTYYGIFVFDEKDHVTQAYIFTNDKASEYEEPDAPASITPVNKAPYNITIDWGTLKDGKVTGTISVINASGKVPYVLTNPNTVEVSDIKVVDTNTGGNKTTYTFTLSKVTGPTTVTVGLINEANAGDDVEAAAQEAIAAESVSAAGVSDSSGDTSTVREAAENAAKDLIASGATAGEAVEAIAEAMKDAGLTAKDYNSAAKSGEDSPTGNGEPSNYMAEIVSSVMQASGDTVAEQLAAAEDYIDWFIKVTGDKGFKSGDDNEYGIIWENLKITKGTTTDYEIELDKDPSSNAPKGNNNGLANIFYNVGVKRGWSDGTHTKNTDMGLTEVDYSINAVLQHLLTDSTCKGKLSTGVTVTVKFFEKDTTKEADSVTILFKTAAA